MAGSIAGDGGLGNGGSRSGHGCRNGRTLGGRRTEGRKGRATAGTSDGRDGSDAARSTKDHRDNRDNKDGGSCKRDGRDEGNGPGRFGPFPRRPWRLCCPFGRCSSGRRRCRPYRRSSLGRCCPSSLPSFVSSVPLPAVPFRSACHPPNLHLHRHTSLSNVARLADVDTCTGPFPSPTELLY